MRKIFALILLINVFFFAQNDSSQAPNFSLKSIEGKVVELNSLVGSGPIVISFWATWCKPCVAELKHFNEFYNEYKDKGLKLLAISTDSEKSVSKVVPFVRANGYSFPVLLDTGGEVARKYYAQMVPFTVVVNKSGNVVHSHLGYKPGDELKVKEIIEQLLNEN